MNAANSNYEEQDFNYGDREKQKEVTPPSHARRSRHPASRRAKGPDQFNGMHRRRSKKINW